MRTANEEGAIPLHESIYPSWKFPFRHAHFSIFMTAVGVCTYLMSYGLDGFFHVPQLSFTNLHYPEFLVLRLHLFFCLLELGYWEIYRRNFHLYMDDKRLIVRKGVFRIAECSFPLTHGTEVYLVRSMRDILLGIWSVHIPTPGQGDAGQPKSSKFDGLNYQQAIAFRRMVTNVINEKPIYRSVNPEQVPQDSKASISGHRQLYPQIPGGGLLALPSAPPQRFFAPLPTSHEPEDGLSIDFVKHQSSKAQADSTHDLVRIEELIG